MEQDDTKLLEAAKDVRTRAYAPYSDFKVGAAVETENGDIYTGLQCRVGELRAHRLCRARRHLERHLARRD
jgi:cytidine deaminase